MSTHPELPDSQLRSIALQSAIDINRDEGSRADQILADANIFYSFLNPSVNVPSEPKKD